jgi:hypothetical protein
LKIMPSLQERGVRHFRVELLAESSLTEVRRTLTPYQRRCKGWHALKGRGESPRSALEPTTP